MQIKHNLFALIIIFIILKAEERKSLLVPFSRSAARLNLEEQHINSSIVWLYAHANTSHTMLLRPNEYPITNFGNRQGECGWIRRYDP